MRSVRVSLLLLLLGSAAAGAGAIACDLSPTCNASQCTGARFTAHIRGPDVELPAGSWVVSADVEDGTFEAECEVGDGEELSCGPGAWVVAPSRDLKTHLEFIPSFERDGEIVPAEARLITVHPDVGADSVEIEVEVDGALTHASTQMPTYEPESEGTQGCPTCPGGDRVDVELEL